jgi:hypothetical protein
LSKSFNEFEWIFLHWFRCDLLEFKWVQCWSTRWYFDK